jgi:hypothetical protein
MRYISLSALSLVLLAAPSVASAWGWSQPRGAHYVKIWNRSLIGSRAFFADGMARALPTGFGDHALNYYFEYGITDRWTLVSNGAPIGLSVFNGQSAVYVGPLSVGARRGLIQGTWNLAVEAHYGFAPPVGTTSLGTGLVEGNRYVYLPAVETHQLDGEVQLGRGIGRGWVTAHAGARWYSADQFDPAIFAGVQGGYTFSFGLQLSATVSTNIPVGPTQATSVTGTGQTRYVGFGLDVSYWLNSHWGINAGFGGVFLAQSNAATPSLTLGFEHR